MLSQIASGDECAFKQLVDENWAIVFRNILTLTKRPEIAQEITQDIFLKLWQQRTKLPEINDFMAYVYVLGRNKVISSMRSKLLATVPIDREDFAESRNLPELELEYKETLQLIMVAIDRMPNRQREIFKLSRIKGLSNQEIADKLGVSVAAVKWQIVAGLNTVRLFLSNKQKSSIVGYLIFTSLMHGHAVENFLV